MGNNINKSLINKLIEDFLRLTLESHYLFGLLSRQDRIWSNFSGSCPSPSLRFDYSNE